ncbi:MAG: transketolase, partial [Myxococcota bacterium]
RVVSMPCVERFMEQTPDYRRGVLPDSALKISIEAGRTIPWQMLTGSDGMNFGVDTFGESGPYEEVYAHFGLTTESIFEKVQAKLQSR